MNSLVYWKLAWQTLSKNGRNSWPFLLGSMIITSTLYCISTLRVDLLATGNYGARTMGQYLEIGLNIMIIFAAIFYFYINGFLMRSRQKEYGLFSTLGLEKKHLIRILFYQMLILWTFSTLGGIIFGMVLSRLVYMGLGTMLQVEDPLRFSFHWDLIGQTAMMNGGFYILIMLWSSYQIMKKDPLELLKAPVVAQTEPKNKWFFALCGIIFLGVGYGMALTIDDPLVKMMSFFLAVVFVIIGTYSIFMYGSITLIKILEKNKKYYYNARHFISLSNMKYRMRQNAMSLATLCILSTMILVTLATTLSLWLGVSYAADDRYLQNYKIEGFIDPNSTTLDQEMQTMDNLIAPYQPEDVRKIVTETFFTFGDADAGSFTEFADAYGLNGPQITVTDAAGYQAANGSPLSLGENQIMVVDKQNRIEAGDVVSINGDQYEVAEVKSEDPSAFYSSIDVQPVNLLVVVPDLNRISGGQNVVATYYFESPVLDEHENIYDGVLDPLNDTNYNISRKQDFVDEMLIQFASLFLIGVFCCLIFGITLVLIMYYKQISEGNEDRARFAILQKVGLEKKQIRKVINDQAAVMFFMPLIVAAIHIAFAYPFLADGLLVLFIGRQPLFTIAVFGGTLLLFGIIYALIYKITANTYYSIVSEKSW